MGTHLGRPNKRKLEESTQYSVTDRAVLTLGVGVPSETAVRTTAEDNWSRKVEQQQGKSDQFLHTREDFVIDGHSSRVNGHEWFEMALLELLRAH